MLHIEIRVFDYLMCNIRIALFAACNRSIYSAEKPADSVLGVISLISI